MEQLLVVTVSIGVDDQTGAISVKATPDDPKPFTNEDLAGFALSETQAIGGVAGRVSHWIDKMLKRKIEAVRKDLEAKESELANARKRVQAMLK